MMSRKFDFLAAKKHAIQLPRLAKAAAQKLMTKASNDSLTHSKKASLQRDPSEPQRNLKAIIVSAVVGLILMVLLVSGLFLPIINKPHIVVVAYVIVSIIFKLKSQLSFTIALILLLIIPFLIIFSQQALAETYAAYCFYFLTIGVIFTTLELRTLKR